MADDGFPLPNASIDLTGQVALVTGATSGLGWRYAQVLAAAGARVVGVGRRQERLDALVEDITARGGQCAVARADVTDHQQIIAAVDAAEAAFGTVTILVNNAGIPDAQRAHRMSIELIDNVISINLRGPFVLACEVARRLIAAKLPGRIVNMSSMISFEYRGEGSVLYSTTKAALNRMTEALAVEWARYGINVNAIAAGAFSSEMLDGMLERMGDITEGFPRKRIGSPAQLDSTLLYLVSPASECVTGTVIKVDDGQAYR